MSWWGTLIGGAMGYAVGGPIGMLLGAAMGRNFGRGVSRATAYPGGGERKQIVFYTATFSVMGHLCKADGQVSRSEIDAATRVMEHMSLSRDMAALAMKLFEQGKQPQFSMEQTILQLRQELGHQPNLYRMFMEIQIMAAYADGKMHAAEKRVLMTLCRLLDFPLQDFTQLCDMIGGAQAGPGRSGSQGMSLEQAYRVLAIDSSASKQEVVRAYRRLLSRHHPDKLIAKGLPEEMIKVANERTADIRKAYNVIKENRGP